MTLAAFRPYAGLVRIPLIFLAVILLLVLFIAYAKAPAASQKKWPRFGIKEFPWGQSQAHSTTLKVVTYNMGYASGDQNNKGNTLSESEMQAYLKQMAEALQELQPDVVFLQEVDFEAKRSYYVNQFEALAKELQLPFGAHTILWNKNYVPYPYWPPTKHFGKVISGQAILSRYPLKDHKVESLPRPPHAFWYNWFYLDRVKQSATMKWGSQEVALWNVHHEAFHGKTRLEQVELLAKDIKANSSALKIVGGDFNDPSGVPENQIPKGDVADSFTHFENLTGLQSDRSLLADSILTFPAWQPEERLDHVLASAAFELKTRKVLCLESSDHCLVYTEWEKR